MEMCIYKKSNRMKLTPERCRDIFMVFIIARGAKEENKKTSD